MNPFIAFRDLINRIALAPYDTHQIKSIPLMTTITAPATRELYATYSWTSAKGLSGFGRTTFTVQRPPADGLLTFANVQEMEALQKEKMKADVVPDVTTIFLTNWQWLAPEPS